MKGKYESFERHNFKGSGSTQLGRRDFLRLAGLGATAAITFHPWEFAMAGPFTRSDFGRLVPSDKKLSAQWVKSLFERGAPTVYTRLQDELKYIGMPVGGLCAGQLYLGGDGRLWHWDVFNHRLSTGADHYAKPMIPSSPLEQGFAIRLTADGKSQERTMDAENWEEVSFNGEYPIGHVSYSDPGSPVTVKLEAFSPFLPLNFDDSSLPATLMEFTIRNKANVEVEGEFAGWLENAVCLYSAKKRNGVRINRAVHKTDFLLLECFAEDVQKNTGKERPDIIFDDFEGDSYEKWTVTGTAFGKGPVDEANVPAYQGKMGAHGKRLVNSHATAPGNNVGEKDAATGQLLSHPFTIERNYITFLLGGGNHEKKTCINLLIGEKVVLSTTGSNKNHLEPASWNVQEWVGKTAQIAIVDAESGGWGNIGVDHIVFTDNPNGFAGPLSDEADFGSMGLVLLSPESDDTVTTSLPLDGPHAGLFSAVSPVDSKPATRGFDQKLMGAMRRKFKLLPGQSVKVMFAVTWFMPNLKMNRLPSGRYYDGRFDSAQSVAAFLAKEYPRLATQTRLWHDTWYDSTLPYWFLDRTFLNTSILATSTCYRFKDGRFYSWEGVGCCEGTCGHVWHYAQAVARVFPEIERLLREKIDFGPSLQKDGAIHFRGEFNDIPAVDAQAGAILRMLREHEMSVSNDFLKRNWPHVKKATQWLIAKDENGDGLIESNQHNTLDTDWFGPVAWLSGLYLAALLAAEEMAKEVEDQQFADQCHRIFTVGHENLVKQLFEGEYFINKVDPKHADAINSGTGCEIDQVMGQSWAFQVGLPRVFPKKETMSALQSLWLYNFTPDVGPYRKAYTPGRWYAMPGEAGLLICTFPRRDWDYLQAKGKGADWAAGYFNECMNGFEYQVAGHMIWEGMILEGLAVTRAVHDRYHASRRNPWNEIECGDHYVRSMASYGVYTAACGFEYHGPHGRLGFAPKLTPENFKCAFVTAQGWGTFRQRRIASMQSHEIEIRFGQLRLQTFVATLPLGAHFKNAILKLGAREIAVKPTAIDTRIELNLTESILVKTNEKLVATIEFTV